MIVCGFRLALIQLKVGSDKTANICRAIEQISKAKQNGASVVSLPECFNSPYGTKHFPKYAESVPNGETCNALSKSSQENEIYVVGGTIPERDIDGKLYNTCTVWGPTGDLITTYRKVHLFDISIPGKVTFRESDVLSPGNSYATFSVDNCKIGIGICYDIRFGEMARIYRNEGCQMLIYPGAFNMNTGPLHWELLHRARAVDCQLYVAGCSPSRHKDAGYIAWGHSLIVSPWGHVLQDANEDENIIYEDIDLKQVDEFRSQIPIYGQRRTDLYNTVNNILVKNP